VEKLTGPDTYCEPIPFRGGLGTELAKWVTKAVIHKAQLSKQIAKFNMVTKAAMCPS